jgi:xanthine dehydrogenase accessory factor
MKDVLETLDAWAARGDDAAVATVVAVRRSAPRPPGAKMAVSSAGDVVGMVSGGCVEGAVIQEAQEVLQGGPPRLLQFGIADDEAWEVGLPCGGEIDVWVQRHDSASPFAAVAREDGRAVELTELAGDDAGRKRLLVPGDRAGGAEELMWLERSERRGDVFADATFPAPRLLIFGAVDYADALSRLARTCGWRPYVIDPRGFFARPDRFPAAEEVVAAWPEEALARIGGLDRLRGR